MVSHNGGQGMFTRAETKAKKSYWHSKPSGVARKGSVFSHASRLRLWWCSLGRPPTTIISFRLGACWAGCQGQEQWKRGLRTPSQSCRSVREAARKCFLVLDLGANMFC